MRTPRKKTAIANAKQPRDPESTAFPVVIAAVSADPGFVKVQRGPDAVPLSARLAVAAPYHPSVGDRVLVIPAADELYVIGVLSAVSANSVPLPDGGAIHIHGDIVDLVDSAGRLRVRYANGVAEVAAPEGDLVLAAPAGKVVVRAASDVEVEAPRLSVKTAESQLVTSQAKVIADRITTTASTLTQSVERLEVTAIRLVERSRDAYREVSDLCETRAGRVRALVKDVYTLYARRTTMASKDETSIDGSKVLLG